MMLIMATIAVIIILGIVFYKGVMSGKRKEQFDSLKEGVTDALETKKRTAKRSRDSIATISKRMRKNTRD